ncbi:hypothetical protein PUNSTDRAFT_114728 [Punctularia strigosozonata HHB-11173 SS5]|uniref:uncharacterized protein n=1 Tax=Punctularia strigosozonata (strain HHB-11173) TaxID=741275 RepID=UPI00044176FC|nr:uncharacterized protein PUNSTDRAFT_114728 [Punctularia strigosozonata HHB-11173 SS5]EIN07260.1 hypothetical protein PUNSTDRAFT_114728 [Punctularia strigosozonata HHB-11173 SS5]
MSVTGPAPSPFAFGLPDATMTGNSRPERPRPSTSSGRSGLAARSRFSSAETDDSDSDSEASPSMSHHQSKSPSRDRSMSRSRPRAGQTSRPSTSHGLQSRASVENVPGAHGNEVPQEYRAEVDRIFFEFLTRICSDLDATDSKGEPIHQTLMAKKMQRLDESPDFRPFKFRIAAFTNAFLEELARQGYPEEIIPMKKIRNYLWNQSYISRFNEEGKKTKSKGNHIWSIDAKKTADGGWTFRPFHRRLAGNPPSVAYVGLRWSWHPRIWDPQNSRLNLPVIYSSPSLPSWLSWEDDVLSGIPPPDAESCDVTVEARFVQDGQEETLSQTVHVNIAPMSNVDAFPAMRRPSLSQTADGDPRRIASEANAISGPLRPLLRAEPAVPPPALAAPKRETQVMQVLASAAQRVAQEAQSQVIASSFVEPGPELHALAKQQHVLTVTAQAVDNEMSGRMDGPQQQSTVLAAAAQHVVFQAAMQVAADRAEAVANQISAGMIPAQSEPAQVTVNDVSMATQTAVAQAVELTGPLSSEVDVLMTASSLLQQQQGRVPLATAPVLDRPMAPAAPHLIPSTSIPPPVFPPAASF